MVITLPPLILIAVVDVALSDANASVLPIAPLKVMAAPVPVLTVNVLFDVKLLIVEPKTTALFVVVNVVFAFNVVAPV